MITRKTSLLFIVLAITSSVSAQYLHLGIKGNTNLTKSKGYNFYDKNSYGYNFGGFLSYNFTSIVGVQLEALYGRTNLRTNSVSENESSGIGGGKKKLNYMSFPLLVKVDAGSLFSAVASPQFNSLRNPNKHQLNNGERAFDSKA